jgi:Domain of unknown function (DUF4129)
MRSLFEKKPLVLLLAVLALGALTVLSVSLRSVSFKDAQPIGWEDASPLDGGGVGGGIRRINAVPIKLQIGLFISLIILAGLVSLLVSAEARKRFLRLIFRLAITYWVLSYVLKEYPDILTIFSPDALNEAAPPGTGQTVAIPPAIFTPPQQTPLLSYVIGVLVVLVSVLSIWWLWKKMNPRKPNTLSNIAKIARASLRDLSAGGDSTDVILKCYARMSDVVSDRKNIQRGLAVTPTEFAVNLERSGLPGSAVKNLTRLFESVRYGSNKVGPKEINEAVACLTAILHYCGEPV